MLDRKYLAKVRADLLTYAEKRREVIKTSGDALHLSKKAIFAIQRGEEKESETCLKEAAAILSALAEKHGKDERVFDEGSYHAALEEYAEAALFAQFVRNEDITQIAEFDVDSDTYVGALSDVVGEIYRYAIKSATNKKFDEVERCYLMAEDIVEEMVDMNLTGYNRQKFDQAKGALQKLEQVRYEVSLRR